MATKGDRDPPVYGKLIYTTLLLLVITALPHPRFPPPNLFVCVYKGDFVYALFDLANDPYEKNNLYDEKGLTDTGVTIESIKAELYGIMEGFNNNAQRDDIRSYKTLMTANVVWQGAGGYIVPYLTVDADYYTGTAYSGSYPELCVPTITHFKGFGSTY